MYKSVEEQAATVVTAFVFCFTMDFYLVDVLLTCVSTLEETNVDDSNCWRNSPVKVNYIQVDASVVIFVPVSVTAVE